MSSHDELHVLADEYWESVLAAFPSYATLLGDRRFDDRIEDVSGPAETALAARWADQLARVDELDVTSLDATDRVTASLLRSELARGIEGVELRLAELASDQMEGVHANLLMTMPQISAPTPSSADAMVERYRQVGTLLDQAAVRFREGLAAGRTPARLAIERSLNQVDGYLALDLADDPFVTFDGPADWDPDAEATWRSSLASVAEEVIRPAFARYRSVLADELLPVARPDDKAGLLWLGDDGAALYQALVRQHTTLDDLPAEEIHQLGLASVARLADEYAAVGSRLFGTREQAEIFARLAGDSSLRYGSADEIMAHVRLCVDGAWARIPEWFGRLPESPCDVVPVPDYLAADAPTAYYFPPAADGSRPGAYFVNLHEPTRRGRFETASVAYHEGIPGHHLQLTIATELTGVPDFQRLSFGNTAFAEGWALYTERLADEMGLYHDDIDRVGLLAGDSWRSCRLVVDTGLHALGWSREQAVQYLMANVPASEHHIRSEVDRYVAMPAQALSYKVGQLEIQRLRSDAEARSAGNGGFDIKAFHDTVLGSGTVSLPVLRDLVGSL